LWATGERKNLPEKKKGQDLSCRVRRKPCWGKWGGGSTKEKGISQITTQWEVKGGMGFRDKNKNGKNRKQEDPLFK